MRVSIVRSCYLRRTSNACEVPEIIEIAVFAVLLKSGHASYPPPRGRQTPGGDIRQYKPASARSCDGAVSVRSHSISLSALSNLSLRSDLDDPIHTIGYGMRLKRNHKPLLPS